MGDVTVTGGSVEPQQHEVPVQTEQGSTPAPIGNQAPDRPGLPDDYQRQSGRAQSRREAIQEAFERAANPPPKAEKRTSEPAKPAAKPAEAKPGHNQPPEDEKLDLKKRPSEQ